MTRTAPSWRRTSPPAGRCRCSTIRPWTATRSWPGMSSWRPAPRPSRCPSKPRSPPVTPGGRGRAAGTGVKIMPGARLPAGADAVVRVEWTDGGRHKAAISRPVYPGDAVREAGYDAQPGDVLLPAGTRLGPRQLGLLAAAGQPALLARPRP